MFLAARRCCLKLSGRHDGVRSSTSEERAHPDLDCSCPLFCPYDYQTNTSTDTQMQHHAGLDHLDFTPQVFNSASSFCRFGDAGTRWIVLGATRAKVARPDVEDAPSVPAEQNEPDKYRLVRIDSLAFAGIGRERPSPEPDEQTLSCGIPYVPVRELAVRSNRPCPNRHSLRLGAVIRP